MQQRNGLNGSKAMSNTISLRTLDRKDWETPPEFFQELNDVYQFTLDPCATKETAKCSKYYTEKDNGLEKDWGGERVYCNPPYGKEIPLWVKKASEEASKPNTLIVMLLPARTDTTWFHDYIYNKAAVYFVRGRLRFVGAEHPAPFPSMIVVFE